MDTRTVFLCDSNPMLLAAVGGKKAAKNNNLPAVLKSVAKVQIALIETWGRQPEIFGAGSPLRYFFYLNTLLYTGLVLKAG